MSAPFGGPPDLPFDTERRPPAVPPSPTIHEALAGLPRPRKHYQWWYSTRSANARMWRCTQGVHDFLRAYFHHKSADWKQNQPHPLAAWSAEELAKMPTYYIMDLADDMPAAVAKEMPSPQEIARFACGCPTPSSPCMPRSTSAPGSRAGSTGYRSRSSGAFESELELYAGRTIDVPSIFILGSGATGASHQCPGAVERMQKVACTRMVGCHLLEGAGHWVQQEQAARVSELLVDFLKGQKPRD